MSKKRLAIYDLDNTLIDTDKLKKLRELRNWKEVYVNFDKTILNQKIRNYIENLNSEIFDYYIVVTSSPKVYAEKLLKYHNFLEGVKIIGYHDTQRRKPFADPYLKALENFQDYDEIYIFGDDEKDFIAAEELEKLINKKVYKVGCSWYVKCDFLNLDRELRLEEI
ncbi:MAG: HAD-IA family hydrolase [Fusobacteriaceae bacterium]